MNKVCGAESPEQTTILQNTNQARLIWAQPNKNGSIRAPPSHLPWKHGAQIKIVPSSIHAR